jgi:pimeloyl-ACP methyl ester carboxylesterase
MTSALEHNYADLDDVRLHYVSAGQGPAAVLLHGWPQTWFMWRDIMPGLAKQYRVVAPDLRGLGSPPYLKAVTTRRPSPTTSGVSCTTC